MIEVVPANAAADIQQHHLVFANSLGLDWAFVCDDTCLRQDAMAQNYLRPKMMGTPFVADIGLGIKDR